MADQFTISSFTSGDEYDQVSAEDISPSFYLDSLAEPLYRSIAISQPVPFSLDRFNSFPTAHSLHSSGIEKPTLKPPRLEKSSNSAVQPVQFSALLDLDIVDLDIVEDGDRAPELPSHLLKTNIRSDLPLEDVLTIIDNFFGQLSDVSFSHVVRKYTWEALLCRGNVQCKFQVHVYQDSNSHVIEAHRLSGDNTAFQSVYQNLKLVFSSSSYVQRERDLRSLSKAASGVFPLVQPSKLGIDEILSIPLDDASYPSPAVATSEELERLSIPQFDTLTEADLSEADVRKELKSLYLMAASSYTEAKCEAARMIYSLSSHESLLEAICDSGCVRALVEIVAETKSSLMSGSFDSYVSELACQNAVLALAKLSEAHSCQEEIINVGLIPVLLHYIVDGTLNCAEIRRDCARILANLSSRLAGRIAQLLGTQTVSAWTESVDSLSDDKLRLHANRAKEFLRQSLAVP